MEAQQFGKGKRIRKQINYASENLAADANSKKREKDDDYVASDIETDTSEEVSGEEEEGGEKSLVRKSKIQGSFFGPN